VCEKKKNTGNKVVRSSGLYTLSKCECVFLYNYKTTTKLRSNYILKNHLSNVLLTQCKSKLYEFIRSLNASTVKWFCENFWNSHTMVH